MKRALVRNSLLIGCTILAATSLTSKAIASDFNLPFVNVAGLGVTYADWATAASDASTAFTNPAGLTYLRSAQLALPAIGLLGHTSFTGSSSTPPFPFPFAVNQSGVASSHLAAFIPSFYYAAPISDRLVFGFGQTVPFALGTSYATDSVVRYAATRSRVVTLDLGPSLGFKVNDKLSIGAGLDAMYLAFTLNNMYGPPVSIPDAEGLNQLNGWGAGYHAGILYQPKPATRIGASFNSMVMLHTRGTSAVFAPSGRTKIDSNRTDAALPARAQVSLQQDLNPIWTVMGTVFYTNWRTFDKITMQKVVVPGGDIISVTIPFNYHNTFDYAGGVNYKPTDKLTLKVGAEYMNTPSNNRNRSVADPIGRAVVVGVGAHFQQTPCMGFDFGYGHSFFKQESVHLRTPLTNLDGHNNAQTNVFGAQININV